MTTNLSYTPYGSRFVNICVANWFLQIYVFSIIPLLFEQMSKWGYLPEQVGWVVFAFGVGMVLPGPFGAYLMERRSRKSICLKAILALGPLATLGYVWAQSAEWLILIHGFQGLAFGIVQTSLGSTLLNDVLLSKQRSRGDLIYAWAGRLGIPVGLFLGYVLSILFPVERAFLWALVPCLLAILIIIPTNIPLKAPVKVPVLTLDRFFLPRSLPLCFSMFAASWMLGRIICFSPDGSAYLSIALGTLLAFLMQLFLRHRVKQRVLVCLNYLLVILSLVILESSNIFLDFIGYVLIGIGISAVSSRHLMDWIDNAEHCQRGTAQNTFMISWRMAFSLGFLAGCYRWFPNILFDGLLCGVSLLLYVCWVAPHNETAK